MHPTPVLRSGQWHVDLRRWGFGRHILGPGAWTEAQAIHAAYRMLDDLRGGAQRPLSLFDPKLAAVFDSLLEVKRFRSEGGEDWWNKGRRRLGPWAGVPVSSFEGHEGSRLALVIRDKLREGIGPGTCNDVLNVLFQGLSHAKKRGWLQVLPDKPAATNPGEKLKNPRFVFWTEGDFRKLRDGMLVSGHGIALPPGMSRAEYVAKRRLYLSFSFYTGMHTADLDRVEDSWVAPDLGRYWRHNQKSQRVIMPAPFEAPAPLVADILETMRVLGRPFRCGELITGGPWKGGTTALNAAARRLGLGPLPVNHRVFRRSCAREYCLRGWSLEDVAEILGHVDTAMLRQVYVRYPAGVRSSVRVAWGEPFGSGQYLRAATSTADVIHVNFRDKTPVP